MWCFVLLYDYFVFSIPTHSRLGPKSKKYIFVGYDDIAKGYIEYGIILPTKSSLAKLQYVMSMIFLNNTTYYI